MNSLTLPAFAAVNACYKCGHGLIGRPRLQLIISAFGGPAFGVRASEVVGGRLHLGFVFVFVAQLFGLDECAPFVGIHLLMRHERQLVRLNLFGGHQLNHVVISHVDAHRAQAVRINLNEITVFPFFHDVFGVRLAQRVIVYATFQIEG